MATGFGADPKRDANGVITGGTSSQDLRRVIGGLYNQGIISGCWVSQTEGLNYTIATGVVNNYIAGGTQAGSSELVLMPIAAVTVPTSAGPGSGSRTDYVYVKQNNPIADGNADIVYGVTSTAITSPDPRLVIAQFTVPAGMTKTSQATRQASRNYSTPYGAAGKYLINKTDTFNNLIKNSNLVDLSGTVTLPTDRLIETNIIVTVDSDVSTGISDALICEIYIDGVLKVTFSTGKLNDGWTSTFNWTWNTTLSAGTHIITLKRKESADTGKVRLRYSATGGFPGTVFTVKDAGVLD